MLFLETVRERLTLVGLDDTEYWETISQSSAAGIVGGAIYDALIARCAIQARAEILYTWNLSDFQRLGPEVAKRVKTP